MVHSAKPFAGLVPTFNAFLQICSLLSIFHYVDEIKDPYLNFESRNQHVKGLHEGLDP